jgi:hypothetical protein
MQLHVSMSRHILFAVSAALQATASTTGAKIRQLAAFYCLVLLSFMFRAAYSGLLTYASSYVDTSLSDDSCLDDALPVIIYEWSLYSQEIPAILSALSSAMLTVLSVQFILTPNEKELLLTGFLQPQVPPHRSFIENV